MRLRLIIVLLALTNSAWACFSLYHSDTDTLHNVKNQRLPLIEYNFNTDFARQFVAYFNLDKRADYTHQDLSDAAVYLTQLGKYQEALQLLRWLHQEHPNEAKIASNLGFVFELQQELDSATFYLEKSIELSAPNNQEWAHLKLIAAQQQQVENPNWVLEHKVLNLQWDTSFYASSHYNNYNDVQRDSIRNLRYKTYANQFDTLWSIALHLKERIPYTPAPNLIIANAMKELADYLAAHLTIKEAFVAYKIALHYDPSNQLDIQQQLDKIMPNFNKYEFSESIFEERFRPAAALSEHQLKDLPQHRSDQLSNMLSPLYWKAGLALLGVMLVAFNVLRHQRS